MVRQALEQYRVAQIRPLTALRFFAAFFVVLYHTLPPVWFASAHRVMFLGFSSVSFFFILSGFVLAIAYANRLHDLPKKSFFKARFARIYPLYFVTMCLDAPVLLMQRMHKYGIVSAVKKTAITFVSTTFMLQAWWPKRLEGIDNPNWSLSVEAVFYLLFPFAAPALWRLSRRGTFVALGTIFLSGMALVLIADWLPVSEEAITYFPLLHLSQFLCGILLAKIYLTQNSRGSDGAVTSAARLLPGFVLVLAGFAGLLLWTDRVPIALLHDGLLFLLFGPVILFCASGRPVVEKLLSASWLVLLGEASYGLYLLHIVVWHYTQSFVMTGPYLVLQYCTYLVLCVLLSIMSFRYFETPARTLLLRRKERKLENTVVAALSQ